MALSGQVAVVKGGTKHISNSQAKRQSIISAELKLASGYPLDPWPFLKCSMTF